MPKHVFSEADVEQVMSVPDINTTTGFRDRAMVEVLYSSAIRRLELVNLSLYDVDAEGGVLCIRKGKGNMDRVVPIGRRAINWVTRYIDNARWKLQKHEDCSNCHHQCRCRLFILYIIVIAGKCYSYLILNNKSDILLSYIDKW
ncbi:MAG: tyrosine-type recombinase/integrase [Gammaproteobacteria bacterium]|nr:tyrosine-type recombinase/integrase [Gammaproteobacteria bacterium]